ncbi:MAG: DUF4147 domain-containing protein [Rhodospirillales bacterium]|nr:DUF4147 domain-containing protein [Rhodospirillales bacterium]
MHDAVLRALFDAAVAAARSEHCVPPHLPAAASGKTLVVGAGKAAASMASAVEDHWSGPLSGLVVTRYGHGVPCRSIEVVEAAHPMPDAAGRRAAERILDRVSGFDGGDRVLCLVSGGGSALLSLPAPGLTLEDKQAVGARLLSSGATISEINCVRKHLSAIKGGRLAAAAYPASVTTLAISDVPGDDPAVIASGPTVADPTTLADARAVLEKYRIEPPESVAAHLNGDGETPKPGDERLAGAEYVLVATPARSLAAASARARDAGFEPVMLGDAVEGEARDVARDHARCALETPGPAALISGGETTVTLDDGGRGGRNAEYLLALAVALGGRALRPVGLMFLDLDGFKLVNNTLGHDMGDLLLKEAANRLEDCVRTGDTVARLGVTNLPCSCPAWSIPRTPPSSPNASWTP